MPTKSKSPTVPPAASESPGAAKPEHPESTGSLNQRKEIREITHRVMGSRQSNRKLERSGSRRQPKRGHGSQR